jgi:phosphoribosylanthranilate isomerase
MIDVKICGLTGPDGLAAALKGKARFIGLVFFPKSPRHLGLQQAASLAAQARGKAEIVAVTVNADDSLLRAIASAVAPDYLQLHGAEPPARVQQARSFAAKGVIKALAIADDKDLAAAAAFEDVSDILLFDAKAPPGAALPGGNGAAFDWRLLKGRRFGKPWLLSGGLSAENLAAAISESGARAVDVSSGVERAPGVKDPDKIAAFLAAAASSSIST